MDYLVPEMQSYHLDMGSLSGAGEMDPAMHFRDLYGGRGQASPMFKSMLKGRLVTLLCRLFFVASQSFLETSDTPILYGGRRQASCLIMLVCALDT